MKTLKTYECRIDNYYQGQPLVSTHVTETGSQARYAFWLEHFEEWSFGEAIKHIKSKTIGTMRPEQKSQKQLELEVENFNLKFKIGDKVKLEKDGGEIEEVTVRYPASIMCGQSVGWFEEISGCYQLDRIRS